MSALANDMARLLWWYMLWLMRRPWMKALQRRWLRMGSEARQIARLRGFIKQNRFARRWGLLVIRIGMNFVLASALLTIVYLAVLNLYLSGAFSGPKPEQGIG